MHWRLILPNLVYFVGAYLIFLTIIVAPSKDCIWFGLGVYGSFAIALISAWGYTYKFIKSSLSRWREFLQITIAKIIFFLIWGSLTIIGLDYAMESACPSEATFTEFKESGAALFFLILFSIAFSLSLIINFLFWLVEVRNK